MKPCTLSTYNSSTKLAHLVCILIALGVIATSAFAQQTTISLGSGTTSPGGSAGIDLLLTASGGAQPAGIQWTMNYSPADIASVNVAAGAGAAAAGKSVACATSSGSTTCVLYGMNPGVLSNGVAATATFNVASGSVDSVAAIQIAGVVTTDANGIPIPSSGTSGSINILQPAPPALSAISCVPSSVNAPASATCIVTLSGPALSNGSAVALSSNNANITVPSNIVVGAGQSSASFAATVGNISSDQTATLTASISGSSRTFALTAISPAQISSLSCSPSTLSGNASSTCTIAMNKAALAAGSIALASSSGALTVPASATISAGQNSATFAATAQAVTTSQNVSVSASLNGITQSTSIGLTVPVQPGSISCSPATVNAPGTSTCTVLLSAVAPAGGVAIALSSNNANITVPTSVAAGAGQNSASFMATIATISSNQTGLLTASLNGAAQSTTLAAIAPPQISSVSCSPSALNSNSTSSCTITLNKAAISASVVTLSSSNSALTVPASVTVAANQSSATFAATTAVINASQTVTVSGSLNGLSQSTPINLTVPVQPSSLSCSPATVNSPGVSTCTVVLSSAAPAAGAGVALSSNNASVTVPSTITATAGASSVNFTASIAAVTTAQTATLTASTNGVTVSCPLSITAATWSISGVVSPSSLGSAATLTLSGASGATASVDSSGNYMFSGLSKGAYTLTPSKTGYTFTPTTQSVTVKNGNVTVPAFTITQNPPPAVTPDVGVWKDRSTASETIVSPQFSTRAGNELLLAFIAADYKSGANTTVQSVSGAGLTWVLAVRTNTQSGTAEIWRAFATATESRVSVTATLSQRVAASMTVMSFTGVDSTGTNGSGAIGAIASNSAKSGAPSAKLLTTRNNSWVFGVGNDTDQAIARTLGTGQTIVHQYPASVGATFWVQSQTATTPVSGSTVTINDLTPTADRFNLSIVEILAAPAAPLGGSASPSGQISHAGTATVAASAPIPGTSQPSTFTLANIATGQPGDVCSPGGLASILGPGLGVQSPQKVDSFPLPTKLAGVQVKVNGTPAPLLFASDSQINFQCPILRAGTPLTLTVEDPAGVLSTPILSEMQSAAPGLFTFNGTKQGVVLIANTNEIAMETTKAIASRPAKPGEFLTIYTSGLGESVEEIAAGAAAPSNRQILLKNKVTIVVGGLEIEPDFAGLAPNAAGLYQINLQLPSREPLGDGIPLYVNVTSSDGTIRHSNSVNVAIQAGDPQQ